MPSEWATLLSGVVGSRAYGFARPDSDIDRLEFAAAPTEDFHGLSAPLGKAASRVTTEPDVTVHEIGKAVSLLLKCNPTVTELLWLENYDTVHFPLGARLLVERGRFLSAPAVRNAYLGYAWQQFEGLSKTGRFSNVPRAKTEKNARHMFRLVDQGIQLYTTGNLTVRVADRDRIFAFGRKAVDDPVGVAKPILDKARETFAGPSALELMPDIEAAERFLRDVRRYFF